MMNHRVGKHLLGSVAAGALVSGLACGNVYATEFSSAAGGAQLSDLSISGELRTQFEQVRNADSRYSYAPESRLYFDISHKSLPVLLELVFDAGQKDFLQSDSSRSGLQRAALRFDSENSLHRLTLGYLGDVRLFSGSFAESHLRPVTINETFRNERIRNFVGAELRTGVQISDKWRWTVRGTAGRTYPDHTVDLTYLTAFDYLRENNVNYAPYVKQQLQQYTVELLDRAQEETDRLFDDIARQEATGLSVSAQQTIIDVADVLRATGAEGDTFSDSLSAHLSGISTGTASADEIKAAHETIDQMLLQSRHDALATIAQTPDSQIRETVETIVDMAAPYVKKAHQPISGKEMAAFVLGAVTESGGMVDEALVANLTAFLRHNQGNTNRPSYLIQTQIERITDTGHFYAGIHGGRIAAGDWVGGRDEYYASVYGGVSKLFGEQNRFRYDMAVDIAGFKNYLHLPDVHYGLASVYNQISLTPRSMPRTTLHYGVGASYDFYYGGALHQEAGVTHRFADRPHYRAAVHMAVGQVDNFDDLSGVTGRYHEYNNVSFHKGRSTAFQVGLNIRF